MIRDRLTRVHRVQVIRDRERVRIESERRDRERREIAERRAREARERAAADLSDEQLDELARQGRDMIATLNAIESSPLDGIVTFGGRP